jgi:hypothetical protein
MLFVLFLGLVAYNAVRSAMANSQFDNRLAQLTERGVPLSLDDVFKPPLPEDDNAQTWIRRGRPHTEELTEILMEYYETEEFHEITPNIEQVKFLIQVFEQYEDVVSNYTRAASCPGHQSDWRIGIPPEESLQEHLENTSEARAVVRCLFSYSGLLMAEGKYDEALDLGLQMMSLSKLLELEPMVVGYMTGIDCRMSSLKIITEVLERRIMDDEQRDRIEAALAECEKSESIKQAFSVERIFGLATFKSQIFMDGWRSLFTWKFKLDACDYLDLMDEITGLMDKPRHAIKSELDSLGQREVGQITASIIRAFLATRLTYDRSLADVRGVRLLNALQREFPDGIPPNPPLERLPGSPELRQDPFTGDDLIVRTSKTSLAIYSVGINGIDDNGSFEKHEDYGFHIELRE